MASAQNWRLCIKIMPANTSAAVSGTVLSQNVTAKSNYSLRHLNARPCMHQQTISICFFCILVCGWNDDFANVQFLWLSSISCTSVALLHTNDQSNELAMT